MDEETKKTRKIANTEESDSIKTDDYNGMDGHLTENELRQDAQFMNQLTDNTAEIYDEVTAGAQIENTLEHEAKAANAKKPVSIEEAKMLLNDETRRLNQELKKTEQKNRKTFIIVIIVALILCAVGAAFALIMGSRHKDDDQGTGNPPLGNLVEDEPDITEPEIIALDVNNELVQELYQRFENAKNPWEGKWNFYIDEDVADGHPSRYMMLTLAKARLSNREQTCKGDYEFEYNDGTVVSLTQCYSGDEMRQEIKEMFGEEMAFTEEDVAGTVCRGYHYNAENDEFHAVMSGCGGSWPASIVGKVVKAEEIGDVLYIYEKALMQETDGIYKISSDDKENLKGELIGYVADPDYDFTSGSYEEYNELVSKNIDKYLDNSGDTYKWIFAKSIPDGNYVFAGLEKLGD